MGYRIKSIPKKRKRVRTFRFATVDGRFFPVKTSLKTKITNGARGQKRTPHQVKNERHTPPSTRSKTNAIQGTDMVGLATRVGGGAGKRGEAWWGLLQGWGGNREQGGGMVGLATRVGGEQGSGGRHGGACYKGGGGGMVAWLQGWAWPKIGTDWMRTPMIPVPRIRSYEFTFGFDEISLKLKIIWFIWSLHARKFLHRG